ncbi:MAG: AMP-binding protein [Ignavibacteria bacterium]|nr:AMP-binding protein [Ignavibacteria bacterium]
MTNSPPRTIPRLFEDSVQRFSKSVMMWEKKEKSYKGSTYSEIQESVHRCAAGLLTLGIKPGDRIGLIAEGRNEWVIAELGILYAGAISVPLSVKLEERSDLKFRLAHSGCRMVAVSGTQAHKVMKMRVDLPDLQKIILFDPQGTLAEDEIGFSELLERGKDYLRSHREELERTWQSVREDDPATISYTSGTTADPKGIILTHRNYVVNVKQCSRHLPQPEWYSSLLILPWDHSFAHTAGVYLLSSIGASMASVQVGKTPMETLRNIPVNIKEVRPTFLLSVPALAKNFRKNIEKGIGEKGKLIWNLFRKGLEFAYAHYGDGWNGGRDVGKPKHPIYRLCDALIFKKIRASFGGRLDYFIGGAAYLDIELQQFFYAIGIPMYQGYGLTEAAPVISANTPAKHKFGSSGTVLPDLQVKICDESGNTLPVGQKGEIVVKGENVMTGYWQNERATREVLREGWLHTGDIGYLDQDGFLFVLGREKSLLISHDGEKYSPEAIEETIVAHSPLIDQVMLYNNQSPYTVALVVPNKEAILAFLKSKKLSCHTEEGQESTLLLLQSEIDRYRAGNKDAGLFPDRWLPSAVCVLGEGFTEQNRMLNSTLKMVRSRIAEFYKNRIDFAFTTEGKNIRNHQNKTIIKRLEEAA